MEYDFAGVVGVEDDATGLEEDVDDDMIKYCACMKSRYLATADQKCYRIRNKC